MDADRALKKLFRLRAPELLALTGDRGARLESRLVPELNAVTRRLDFVMRLKRGREVYLRHLEFEMRLRGGLARRVFEYAAALASEHHLPVVSTAIILKEPAPRALVYEERVRGRRVCWRRIPVLRLWKVKPATAMRLGPGGAALVGLMGRPDVGTLEAAARRIEADAPKGQFRDLSAVLRMLSEGRYTARDLERIVPRGVVMGSSLFAEVRRRSRAEGRAEGRSEGRSGGADRQCPHRVLEFREAVPRGAPAGRGAADQGLLGPSAPAGVGPRRTTAHRRCVPGPREEPRLGRARPRAAPRTARPPFEAPLKSVSAGGFLGTWPDGVPAK